MIISNKTVSTTCTRSNITSRFVGTTIIQSHTYALLDVNGVPIGFIGKFIKGMEISEDIAKISLH